MDALPVVVVGAGPIGLAAAAHLLERGLEPVVLEKGSRPGAAVAEWRYVRLFSTWAELVDPAAARLLAAGGWTHPTPTAYPTGQDWVADYLEPLARALGDRVRIEHEVVGVARRGRDRVVDDGRATEPLTVHVRSRGDETRLEAQAVLDASGTWGSPNPLGGDGLPAIGEHALAAQITYQAPDLNDPGMRSRLAGKHVVVAGRGHSALTALVVLAELARDEPGTRITWLLRRGAVGDSFGGGSADELPARGALGERARAAVVSGIIDVVTGFRTVAIDSAAGSLSLVSADGNRIDQVDEVVVLTGFRPDLSWLSEVRLGLDSRLQAPTELAPLIDPNVHSCGTVYPHGAAQLGHPEPGVYLVGMKSYGRAPTFLAMTGYEQVRSIAAKLAGDDESAARVELSLPETGVCGGAGVFDTDEVADDGGCCGTTTPALIDLAVSRP